VEIVRIGRQGLLDYVAAQLTSFFPDARPGSPPVATHIEAHLDQALQRTGICINAVRAWQPDRFDYLHSTQYCTFLYFLANTMRRSGGDIDVCTKLFLLNKALNGIDLFYDIVMPDVFFIGHSVGIVLAKASYGNYLVLYQNSTVGKNHGVAPVIGEGVVLYPNSAIIGRCHVGDGSVVSQGTSVINQNVPGQCVVYAGQAGALVFKPPGRDVLDDIFRR
jgi:serine O-acetyltransferase